ncbi:MAG: hypothetical protein IKD45_04130 [Clostridia bacterium]|nr:hypothetical protein [Clostridia bacterium]
MLEYFAKISDELGRRCDTLLCDIRSGSSSFFSSYRSLVECFVKTVTENSPHREKYEQKSLTYMLCSDELSEHLKDTVGIDANAHKKIKNYILKINRQVHEREKELDDELLKSYLYALYDFTVPYARGLGIEVSPLTDEKILDNFMADAERVFRADEKQKSLEDVVSRFSKYMDFFDEEIEEKEENLLEEVKASSSKYLAYLGKSSDYSESVMRLLILCAVTVVASALGTLVTSLEVGVYNIFTLADNLFALRMILFAFRLTKTGNIVKLWDAEDLMPMDFVYNLPVKLNKYKVMFVFASIFVGFNIFMFAFDETVFPLVTVSYILTSVAFIIAAALILRDAPKFYRCYRAFAYKYKDASQIYVFFEVPLEGKRLTLDEYKEIYGAKEIKIPK